MDPVLAAVRRAVELYHLFSPGETVVVGVSGGPDSMCLLHVLTRLRSELELTLHVAHLNHRLRAADAEADAEFVRALAADWGLPCTVEGADVATLAEKHHLAVEEAARRARYGFLSRLAVQLGARAIAAGHTADDQAETVLMHWIRGSGLAGLRGMAPATPLEDYRLLDAAPGSRTPASSLQVPTASLRLIRPLLEVARAQTLEYCRQSGLEPRFDRSNLDTTYFRNWLRHEVFPLLARHNPRIQEVIRRSARVVADDYALLRSLLEETWPRVVIEEGAGQVTFDLAAWRALPPSLQRSTLREAIHRLRRSLLNINFIHVEDAMLVARDGTTGDRATLPQGLMLTMGYDRLTVGDAAAEETLPAYAWPLLPAETESWPVAVPGVTALPDSEWALEVREVRREELAPGWESNADPWTAFLDADLAGAELTLRSRRPGDRFQPLGLAGHTVKLSDFLTNRKVPRAVRDRLPLVVDASHILWVCGQRPDDRAAIRATTRQVLVLRLFRSER